MVADKRGGAFADDLYLVMEDNRNGTRDSTNADVFVFKSLDGGSNWIGPTRVNDDASTSPANRDCGRNLPGPSRLQPACPTDVHTGNDQWWPWATSTRRGTMNIVLKDRRLDTDSVATSGRRAGAPRGTISFGRGVRSATSGIEPDGLRRQRAGVMPQPTAPVNPGAGDIPPGAGPAYTGPLDNFGVSDVPSNWDYSLPCRDLSAITRTSRVEDNRVYTLMTDARNGRSSGGPAGGATFPSQPGGTPRASSRTSSSTLAVEPPRWRRTEQSEFERLVLPRHAVSEGHEALAAARKQNSEGRLRAASRLMSIAIST